MLGTLSCLLLGTLAVLALRRSYPTFDRAASGILQDMKVSRPDIERALGISWCLVGLLVLCTSFTYLEVQEPYYFSQDDVVDVELPEVLLGCRTVWAGHFPQYNPYVAMGSPLATLGLSSVTYPPLYVSYAVARHLLHNEYATIEVFSIVHLVCGYLITYALMRRLSIRPMVSMLGSLSFILSGSILMLTRNWHTFGPLGVWLPALLLAAVNLERGPVGARWILGTGLAIGLFYHVGFPQTWLYSVAAFVFVLVLQCYFGRIPKQRMLCAIPALIVGIALVTPLVLQQWMLTRDVIRPGAHGSGICLSNVLNMLFPYPLIHSPHPEGWGRLHTDRLGEMNFFGGIFAFLALLNALVLFSSRRNPGVWKGQVWLICALITLLFAFGSPGPWRLLHHLPVIGMVNDYPWRLLPYLALFSILAGGLFLEFWFRRAPSPRKVELWFAVPGLLILFYHVGLRPPTNDVYGFIPYPQMSTPMRRLLYPADSNLPQRSMAWGSRCADPEYAFGMNSSLSTVFAVPSIDCYDPIIKFKLAYRVAEAHLKSEPLLAARAYGLRWHFIFLRPRSSEEDRKRHAPIASAVPPDQFRCVLAEANLRIHSLDSVAPLAFALGAPDRSLPLSVDGRGIDVSLGNRSTRSTVVVNFLWLSDIHVYIDGHLGVAAPDSWGRITVRVPPETKMLQVRYEPPWWQGILVGMVMLGVGVALIPMVKNASSLRRPEP
jgi:hypothetical protein